MKTAMQEFIDEVEDIMMVKGQLWWHERKKKALEKEKEQIMIANQKGYVEGGRYFTFGMQPISSEEYYNQTYNI